MPEEPGKSTGRRALGRVHGRLHRDHRFGGSDRASSCQVIFEARRQALVDALHVAKLARASGVGGLAFGHEILCRLSLVAEEITGLGAKSSHFCGQ